MTAIEIWSTLITVRQIDLNIPLSINIIDLTALTLLDENKTWTELRWITTL